MESQLTRPALIQQHGKLFQEGCCQPVHGAARQLLGVDPADPQLSIQDASNDLQSVATLVVWALDGTIRLCRQTQWSMVGQGVVELSEIVEQHLGIWHLLQL